MLDFPNETEYRRIGYDEYDEKHKYDWDDTYDMLVGPDNFYCLLTEPEDRVWCRDLKYVVNKLNEQHKIIQELLSENKSLKRSLDNYNDHD